ncbi:MAG TPA: hypothetical protein DCY89_09865 [Gammaproteobacteria bacterium]|nr:hypothetical protein [Gammaproteobacteria bacterium]
MVWPLELLRRRLDGVTGAAPDVPPHPDANPLERQGFTDPRRRLALAPCECKSPESRYACRSVNVRPIHGAAVHRVRSVASPDRARVQPAPDSGETAMFERVGIFARRDDPRVADTLRRLIALLHEHGVAISADPVARELLLDTPDCPPPLALDGRPGELLIALGGDGTLLRATECITASDTPVLGINLGRLGFLADLAPGELDQQLPGILAGRFVE